MKRFFGDKDFYKKVLFIVVPIIIQNGITNFVSMLDNIMVGQVGTEQMSGVAIANQLMFVFNICIFGAISGAGIFGAQFYGSGNHEGVKYTFRFKLLTCVAMFAIFASVFALKGENLIRLYLHDGGDTADLTAALLYGKDYLLVMIIGMIPFTIVQSYASTLRETGETVLPMKAGIVAVLINLCLNYILIYGKFGAPVLGVVGAAIATVISRFVEAAIVVAWTHKNAEKNIFIRNVYKNFRIPGNVAKQIVIKGCPLLLNETLWAAGMAILNQCYSVRGLDVIAGLNISSTMANVFNVVYLSMGNAIAIIVGQLLGAKKMEEARDNDRKLITFGVLLAIGIGLIMICFSQGFPEIYNTTGAVRNYATWFIIIGAAFMPVFAFEHGSYFTLRSGGQTWITFLFDSAFVWVISIPAAFCLTRFTDMPILPLYLICQCLEFIKCIVGFLMVRSDMWMKNIVIDND